LKIPRRKRRGILPVRSAIHFLIRSLTPLQAAGNALAIAGSAKASGNAHGTLFYPQTEPYLLNQAPFAF
jgi:hypothetical protein